MRINVGSCKIIACFTPLLKFRVLLLKIYRPKKLDLRCHRVGARVAWRKGHFGNFVQWIGGQLALSVTPGPRSTEQSDQGSPSPDRCAVRVSLPARKVQALVEELRSISTACPKGTVYRDRLRSLAGLGSWIAGLAPQVKPFIRQIWAAIAARTESGAHPKLVYHKQIAAALHWLELFASGNQGGLSQISCLEDRFQDGIALVCDASLWGGGAACWASASEYYNNVPPLAYLSVRWTSWHERLLDVVIGDPAHQGTFEAYTFLLAVTEWVNESTRGRVIVVGDALGVMHGVITLSAKSEIVDKIEMGLHSARPPWVWPASIFGAKKMSSQTVCRACSQEHHCPKPWQVCHITSRLTHGSVLGSSKCAEYYRF